MPEDNKPQQIIVWSSCFMHSPKLKIRYRWN
nr:MAG TPA: egress protein [Caudoviricetes sp.]